MIGGVANLSIIISAIDKASGTFKKMGTNLAATGAKMKSVGKGMTMGLTLPLIGIGIAAGKMAMDFDDASKYANTMMQATEAEMEIMKKTALDLAKHTGKASADIMRSFYGIASAGYKGAEADKILKIATEGATGGFIEQEKSVDALVKVMSIYGKEGDEARETMDVMFGIVDKGLLTFYYLSRSFARASQFAVPLNIDMKEMGASLGFLSKKFSSSEEAASGLMGLTRAFIKPSNDMKDVTAAWAKEQGLAADTTTAQMVQTLGLKGTLDLLQETTKGNVEMMGKLIPEATGLTAALYLTSEEGAKELTENLDYLNDAAGLTQEKFDEASKSAKVRLAKSMEALKGVLIKVGAVLLENLLPVLDKLAAIGAELGKRFTGLSPTMKKVILIFLGLVAALGPLLMLIGSLMTALPVLAAVFSPIGLVIMALIVVIGLLIKIGWMLYHDWDLIAEGFKIMIVEKFTAIKNFFVGIWETIKRIFGSAIDWIRAKIDSLLNLISKVKAIPSTIKEKVGGFVSGIVEKVKWWQEGGVVPGTGPQLAVVHGGETIIPRGRGFGNISIYIQGGHYLDREAGEKFAEILGKMLRKELRYQKGY